MYINNEDFEKWMNKLSKKLTDIGKDLKALVNTNEVFDKEEKLLDNQDLAFMLKCSFRTLQRYRSNGILSYAKLGHKIYYRVNDVRDFLKEHWDFQTYKKFLRENPEEENPE